VIIMSYNGRGNSCVVARGERGTGGDVALSPQHEGAEPSMVYHQPMGGIHLWAWYKYSVCPISVDVVGRCFIMQWITDGADG
jgi:hypothetical protein